MVGNVRDDSRDLLQHVTCARITRVEPPEHMGKLGQRNARMIAEPRCQESLGRSRQPILQDIYVDTCVEEKLQSTRYVFGDIG